MVLNEMLVTLPSQLLIEFFTNDRHKLELSILKEISIFKKLFVMVRYDRLSLKKAIDVCTLGIKRRRQELNRSRVSIC